MNGFCAKFLPFADNCAYDLGENLWDDESGGRADRS
jgi:hypothetical protein